MKKVFALAIVLGLAACAPKEKPVVADSTAATMADTTKVDSTTTTTTITTTTTAPTKP